ncbi:MAG: penicillin-binding transpeptidase domain-containing protein [Verrucomicrobiales bacterium]|nr:penicillin-binding transpeptidase domain-containing protein [Verrucomicrobiales bacterium]
MAILRPTFVPLFALTAALLLPSLHAQTVQSGLGEDAQAIIDAPAVPVPDQPAVPDTISIPRFEETVPAAARPAIVAQPMVADDVEAVEIPAELIGEEEAEEEEEVEMAEDATLQEEIDEKDSTIKNMEGVTPGRAPLTASALRARSKPEPQAKLGADVMTRTEARTFTFAIPAPRGQMLDRNGYPLAQSKVSYYAAISFPYLGKEVEDAEVLRYAGERILHVNNILGSEWDLPGKTVLQHYKERRWFPLTFSSILTDEEVDELNRQQMEGLKLHPVYVRHYPQGETLSHVIGYVGKRPPRLTGPIVNDEPLWGQGVGVDGLEEAFETDLRGQDGRVNVLFKEDGTKTKEDVLSKPKPGFNVVTAIDLEMQRICESLLAEKVKRGAMVVLDVRTGDIVAMASYPQFNPNDFIPSISQEKYSALVEDPAKPLFPRAYRAAYPPASTFKVPVALGFLESGYISAGDMYPCPNAWTIGDLTMRNWNTKEEGMMNVVTALTRSCNTWFYEVAVSAGADSMSYMATRLGLGQKTGIPLNEVEGFIPSNRWWLDKYGYMMSDGEEAVMSIGQGKVEATPLQIAKMMAAVGNGREVMKPRLVLQIQDLNHEIVRSFPTEVANSLNVDGYSLRTVRRGMYDVVNAGNGTGKAAYHKITVSGKTGTGQWKVAQEQNIAWFAGYFPSKYPIYSFAVIYEGEPGEKVGGGKNAAPVVGAFLEQYLTEENYNRVRDAATELKEVDPGDLDEYSYRDSMRPSIFRTGPGGEVPALEQVNPAEEQAGPEPPQRGGGGLFNRIFKRERR